MFAWLEAQAIAASGSTLNAGVFSCARGEALTRKLLNEGVVSALTSCPVLVLDSHMYCLESQHHLIFAPVSAIL